MYLKKNNEYLILTVIVLLGFVLRYTNLDYLIPQTDEFLHLDEAISYEMRLPASRVFFVKYIGLGMLKPLRLVADDYLYNGRLFVVLFSTANILLVYANSRMFANNAVSLAVTFLVAVSGFNIFFGSIVFIDAIITCFLLIGLLLFQKGVMRDNIALVFFAGVMFFAALANKLIVAPALLFFVVLGMHYGTSLRALLPLALWFSAGCVTCMALIGISLITPDIPLFSLDQITSQISLFLSGGPSVGIDERVAGVRSFISYHHESIVAFIIVCGLLSFWVSGSSRLFFLSFLVNLGFFCAYYPAYARHMHFLSVFVALFLALFLTQIIGSPKTDKGERRYLTGKPAPMVMVIFLLLASIFTLLDTIRMKHNPYQFISDHDRHAFVDGWHSGFGMREVAKKFNDILFEETGNIVIVTNYYGTPGGHYLPYLLRKHLSRVRHLRTWTLDESILTALKEHAVTNRVFLLVESPHSFASEKVLTEIQQMVRPVFHYDKKAADTSLTIYEFLIN